MNFHVKNIASGCAIGFVGTFGLIASWLVNKIYLGILLSVLLVLYQWMIYGRDQ